MKYNSINGENMKKLLIDLIDESFLHEYEKMLEKKDECGYSKMLREGEQELFSELTEEQIKKVKNLQWTLYLKMDDIHFESQKYLLNYAFRLGMEMQKAFDQEDYE